MKQKKTSAWAHLKATISRLKLRSKSGTAARRQLVDQIRYRDQTIIQLRAEVADLKSRTDPRPVFNCVYPAQMMALAVFIVLHGGSLRCAAATAGFYAELMGWKYKAPAFKTVSNWVERCGLHALNLTKTMTGQYVAIVDASIQIGKEQLLLLLGVKAELAASLNRPLTIADVEVMGMEVQSSWTGQEVSAFLTGSLRDRPGLSLQYVVCDQGSNLLAALRSLTLPVVNDCSHIMMNLVKKLFKEDTALRALCATVGQLRQSLTLTDNAFLLPPTLRNKDRFLRIFTLVEWMDRIDAYGENLSTQWRDYLSWGRSYWLDLRLRQVHQLLVMTAKILKHDGLSRYSHDKWINGVIAFIDTQPKLTEQAKAFITAMMAYFEQYAPDYANQAKLQCCSDIIESIFGRYKNKGGMKAISSDVLSIPLYNQPLSTPFIQIAMRQVTGIQVDQWRCRNVCHNRYGIRRNMEKELKNAGG